MCDIKAIRLYETGGPEVLSLETVEIGAVPPGYIHVRHTAIGLNYIDIYVRTGLYPAALPSGLGTEAAGVVVAVGEGVEDLTVGDRIAYATGPLGAYAQERVMPAEHALKLPATIADETAAAMMLQGMTAQYLLRQTYAVKPADTILFHAAAGGVGLIACQWAKALGATVIGTVGSPQKAELAKANGCDHTILYREEDVAARVRELTGGEGVPVVYDSVGASTWTASLKSLRRRGMLVSFGNASGPVPPVAPVELMRHGGLYLTRPNLSIYTATRAELEATAKDLFAVVGSGSVKIHCNQRFSLLDAGKAQGMLVSRRTTGSTILIP